MTRIKLPMDSRIMLLFDFDYAGVTMLRTLLSHMVSAGTLLVAKYWKAQLKLIITDWLRKISYMCLTNKLAAIKRFKKGNLSTLKDFAAEWECFVSSKYTNVTRETGIQMLSTF